MKYFIYAFMLSITVNVALAYTGFGTGYYGDGTIIKEEPAPFYNSHGIIESYSVTEDTVNDFGLPDRETTTFDCMDNYLGQKTCRERRW